jgi:hypothetical protein
MEIGEKIGSKGQGKEVRSADLTEEESQHQEFADGKVRVLEHWLKKARRTEVNLDDGRVVVIHEEEKATAGAFPGMKKRQLARIEIVDDGEVVRTIDVEQRVDSGASQGWQMVEDGELVNGARGHGKNTSLLIAEALVDGDFVHQGQRLENQVSDEAIELIRGGE